MKHLGRIVAALLLTLSGAIFTGVAVLLTAYTINNCSNSKKHKPPIHFEYEQIEVPSIIKGEG